MYNADGLLANNIWKEVRGHIDPYSRREVARAVIKVLKEHTNDVVHSFDLLQKDANAVKIEDDWAPDYDADIWGEE